MSELIVTRTLAYPVDRVWRAMTDPVALAAWFWPQRFNPTAEVDLRVGGRYRIDGPAVGIAVSGEYVAVEPPHKLIFTWAWDGEDDETLVTVDLTATAGGTDVRLRHEKFGTDEQRDEHTQGWYDCLDRLPTWLSSGG
jgi:uncharacterized protein YndB with AHSA1/START domain